MTPANVTESTRFLLIRHAATDHLGERISGRMPGIHLNDHGKSLLVGLEKEVRATGFQEIFSSPLERCRETAQAIAGGKPITLCDEFLELDFGDWMGLSFRELHQLGGWKSYNQHRSMVRTPGGESAYDVQCRSLAGLRRIRGQKGAGVFGIVTHADVIRALVCFVLGMPLDFLLRLQVDPASLTEIEMDERGMRVLRVNWRLPADEC